MVKSIGRNKIFCAVFISGRGSNLRAIYKYSKKKSSKIIIKLVVSNRDNVQGIKFSKKNKIKTKIINFKNSKHAEKKIIGYMKKNNIKLICLAGFMKILPAYFIKLYKGKIINIHPSLLPKYKGLNTHKRVIMNNEKFTGCTIHYVDKLLDSGKIIFQSKVKITKKDDDKSIEKKVLNTEHVIYPKTIDKILSTL